MTLLSIDAGVTRVGSLSKAVRDQLPFALSLAINQTLKDVQYGGVIHILQRFTIRRPDFVRRSMKIERRDFSTKRKLVGRVGLQGPRADIFTKFEKGGVKTPRDGGRSIAIPVDPRFNKHGIVPRGQRPRALIESKRGFEDGKGADRRIRRRVGRGRARGAVTAFLLKPRVRIPDRMDLVPVAEQIVRTRFQANARTALAQAMKTAR